MKSLFYLKFILFIALCSFVPLTAQDDKTKKPDGKDSKKGTNKKEAVEEEKDDVTLLLENFIQRRPYNRDGLRTLPSPFRNLVHVERIRIEMEKQKTILDNETKNIQITDPATKTTSTQIVENPEVVKHTILMSVKQDMLKIPELMSTRNYVEAEQLLKIMENKLIKYKIPEYQDKVREKKTEVEAEHKDWEDINKIIDSLKVNATFTTGKRMVALINSTAVEVGNDLNIELDLNKDAQVILTHIDNGSLRVKFKQFELKKEIIDNE